MFKNLAFAAAIIGSVQADSTSDIAANKLCATTAADGSYFVLGTLTKLDGDYMKDDFYFNWCSPTLNDATDEENRYAYFGLDNYATEIFA